MRRSLLLAAALGLVACGGDDGGGSQPQTEEAALEAAVKFTEGTLRNNPGNVLGFLNEECRASVDDDEIRDALLLAQVFFQSDDFDLDDVDVVGTVTEYDGDAGTATVEIELVAPEGADLGLLGVGDDEIDMLYENEKWVGEDCDFEDTSTNQADDLEEALSELGLSATQDDPIPAGVVGPIGDGFSVAVTEYVPDAFDRITEESNGVEPFIEDGEQIALMVLDVGYAGENEPARLNQIGFQMVGSDGVAIEQNSCGNMANQLGFGSRDVFTGAATTGVVCFAGQPEEFPDAPVVAIQAIFGSRDVFFSPTTSADTPTEISGTSGPSPDGDLTDDRTDPTPLGTAVELEDGWTLTVNGFESGVEPDDDFGRPAPAGSSYALLDVTLAYDGEESSVGAFQVSIDLVGDSNVSALDSCNLNDIPDRLDTFADVFPGGTISGTLCYTVDDADLESLVAYATADSFSDDREFFALG